MEGPSHQIQRFFTLQGALDFPHLLTYRVFQWYFKVQHKKKKLIQT